jgi:hypothetical protein
VAASRAYLGKAVAYVHLNPVAAGIVEDPADSASSGHRAVRGLAPPLLADVHATLKGSGGRPWRLARARSLEWSRATAEARWSKSGVESLPWWAEASDVDEVAGPARHPEATTRDGRTLDSSRQTLDPAELIRRFELASGHLLADLAGRRRNPAVIRGRIEPTTLAVVRYGLRSSGVARILRKDRTTISRWLRAGLRLQGEDAAFRARLDRLDRTMSSPTDDAAMPRGAPLARDAPSGASRVPAGAFGRGPRRPVPFLVEGPMPGARAARRPRRRRARGWRTTCFR